MPCPFRLLNEQFSWRTRYSVPVLLAPREPVQSFLPLIQPKPRPHARPSYLRRHAHSDGLRGLVLYQTPRRLAPLPAPSPVGVPPNRGASALWPRSGTQPPRPPPGQSSPGPLPPPEPPRLPSEPPVAVVRARAAGRRGCWRRPQCLGECGRSPCAAARTTRLSAPPLPTSGGSSRCARAGMGRGRRGRVGTLRWGGGGYCSPRHGVWAAFVAGFAPRSYLPSGVAAPVASCCMLWRRTFFWGGACSPVTAAARARAALCCRRRAGSRRKLIAGATP